MTGTLVNCAAALAGGLIGGFLKKGIPERVKESVLKAVGLAIALIALGGFIANMITVDGLSLRDSGGLMLLVSLVLGCFAGEILKLDDRMNAFGAAIEKKTGGEGFARGFVTASLVFCVGSLSIMGPITEILAGDRSLLYVKSALDFVTAIVLGSALGMGVAAAAAPVLIVQGAFALLSVWIGPYMRGELLRGFCMTGYAIVLCIGLNFLIDAKIKTLNLMPALAVTVLYCVFIGL